MAIKLVDSTNSLSLVTASAVTTSVHVSSSGAHGELQAKNFALTTATTTTLLSGAATLEELDIKNTHASSSNEVTISHIDGAGVSVTLMDITLLAGEVLRWTADQGFRVFNSNGALKSDTNGLITAVKLAADHSDSTGTPTLTALKSGSLAIGQYQVQAFIVYQAAATTTGINLSLDFDGTVTQFVANARWVDNSATAATGAPNQAQAASTGGVVGAMSARAKTQAGFGTTASVDTANADMLMIIEATFAVSVAGSLNLWHGSEVAAASTVKAGSSMVVTKVG